MTLETDALTLYAEGASVRQVAAALGVWRNRVHEWVQRAGISRPNPSPGPPRKVPDVETLLFMRDADVRRTEVAEALGVDPHTIDYHLRRAGKRWGHDRRLGRPDVSGAECERLYLGGWTMPEIAARFGCADRTVWLRLRARGVESRRRKQRIPRTVAR